MMRRALIVSAYALGVTATTFLIGGLSAGIPVGEVALVLIVFVTTATVIPSDETEEPDL